jgi:UDP-N-acetylmuramoylalanine--D-glutamate ligase
MMGTLEKKCPANVLIVGMGRSGQAAARYALSTGARVTCTDLRTDAAQVSGCHHVYGWHERSDFLEAQRIIVSPGVPARQADLQAAMAEGVEVVGELGAAAEILQERGVPLIAVTGTNGKSSVTHYCAHLLRQAGRQVFLGGNIGRPLTEAITVSAPIDLAVVEVSSYQLELPGSLAPSVATILNLSPDHLSRHGDMHNYANTKQRLFARMKPGSWAAVPKAGQSAPLQHGQTKAKRAWLGAEPGVRIEGEEVHLRGTPDDGTVSIANLQLLGDHNRKNVATAIWLAVVAGAKRAHMAPSQLTALPHRLEPVHQANTVSWVNDSKATNVAAALVGILSVERPAIVLLGGKAKPGADYERLRAALERRARAIVCFGEAGPEIENTLTGLPITTVSHMPDAVTTAGHLAQPNDIVLLSPACSSFDEFTDFEARGHAFGRLARELHP